MKKKERQTIIILISDVRGYSPTSQQQHLDGELSTDTTLSRPGGSVRLGAEGTNVPVRRDAVLLPTVRLTHTPPTCRRRVTLLCGSGEPSLLLEKVPSLLQVNEFRQRFKKMTRFKRHVCSKAPRV